jgi:WD40 repeat protein
VVVWDTGRDQRFATELPPDGSSFDGAVHTVEYASSGEVLVAANGVRPVMFWDVYEQAVLREVTIAQQGGEIVAAALSPDGRTLATARSDGVVVLRDAETGESSFEFEGITIPEFGDLTFSADGAMLAAGTSDGAIVVWDAATGERITAPLRGGDAPVRAVEFAPDGSSLASAGDDAAVTVWDLAAGTVVQTYALQSGSIAALAFTPDGTTVAVGTEIGEIALLAAATGEPRGARLAGHLGPVSDLAFAPDGRTLVSAGDDRSLILWNVESQLQIGLPLRGHSGPVLSVAFSPDGKAVASGGIKLEAEAPAGGEVFIWDVDVNSWNAAACTIANRALSAEESTRYLRADSVEQPCP